MKRSSKANSIDAESVRLLKKYDDNKPQLQPEAFEKVNAIPVKAGLNPKLLERIAAL